MGHTRGPVFVLALVGALVLGAALAYWLGPEGRRERETGAGEPADGLESELSAPRGSTQEPVPSREAVASEGAGRLDHIPLAAGELSGRVLDSNLWPLAGARVILLHAEARAFELDLERAAVWVAEAESGPDGAFHFALTPGVPVDVQVTLKGYSDALEPDAYAGQELEIVLTPGVRVFGTLTRARDGTPVEGARVRAFRLGGPSSLERQTTSHADGAYELRIPFREDARLEVVPSDLQCSAWIELEIGPDNLCQTDVALRDGVLVTGRVTAAETGLGLPGAKVGEGWWFRRTVTTDARGEYRLEGFGDPGVLELGARAKGYSVARATAPNADADGVVRLDFVLQRARAVRGRIVDEAGAPLFGAYVAAVASELEAGGQRTDWLSTRTDSAGLYRIDDLSRELGHALLVTLRGYGTQVHDFPESEFETPELVLADIALGQPALLAGRVENSSGAPIADVEVELSGWNHDRYRFTQAPTARARFYVDARSVHSDARGRFWFGDLSAGRYQVVTHVAGRPESAPLELELVTGERREDVVLRLDAGGTIRGQVLDERGNALAGVYVSAQSERLADPGARPAGHVQVRTPADGRFELGGLPAGEYTIRAYPLETPSPDPGEPWLPATVEHVATGAQPIQIELGRGAAISGRVLDAAGAALSGYVVATVARGGGPVEYAQTDAEGRFTLTVPRGSRWTLEVRGSPESEGFRTVFAQREDVVAGTRDLEFRLAR